MDSTKNEVDDVQVQGFPTLKFIRSGTNEVGVLLISNTLFIFASLMQRRLITIVN